MDRSNFIHHGSDDEPQHLAEISGVNQMKVLKLLRAGYTSVDDVRRASQSELAEVEGIGNALAARMKADVGGMKARQSDQGRATQEHKFLGVPYDTPVWMDTLEREDFLGIDESGSSDADDEIEAFVDQLEHVVSDEFDETDREIITILTEHLLDDAE